MAKKKKNKKSSESSLTGYGFGLFALLSTGLFFKIHPTGKKLFAKIIMESRFAKMKKDKKRNKLLKLKMRNNENK